MNLIFETMSTKVGFNLSISQEIELKAENKTDLKDHMHLVGS